MRFEQTRDILKFIAADYHRSLSIIFSYFADGNLSERNRLTVDYLIDHELRMVKAINDFVNEAPEHVLEQWFRQIEIQPPLPDKTILTDSCRTDLNSLTGAFIHFKKELTDFYEYLLRQCEDPETATLFTSLKNLEDKSLKRFIRHIQGLEDL